MPAAKPVRLHFAHGTYRADRHAKRLRVEAAQGGKPLRPPKELPKQLRPLWRRVVATIDAGWLSPADAWLLLPLVVVLDQIARDSQKVADMGSVVRGARGGELVRNPFAISLRQNLDALLRMSVRFGLSPRDRAMLATLAMPSEQPDAGEAFADLLNQLQSAGEPTEADEW